MKRYSFFIFAAFLFLTILNSVHADAPKLERFSGKVVRVEDGDTISVMHGSIGEKIRLFGIDCPEDGQAFSSEAEKYTSHISLNQVVTVIPNGKDVYDRTVADVLLSDGRSLGHEIVKAGLAWWFKKYAPDDQPLRDLETKARSESRGLWADKKATPPWDFGGPAASADAQGTVPPKTNQQQSIASVSIDEELKSMEDSQTVYVNKSSGSKYHRAGCSHLNNRISVSREYAKSRGLKACAVCKP